MLVGLCGPEGAGKTTAARELIRHFEADIVPFAAPLKKMLLALGVPHNHLYGSPAEKAMPLPMLEGKSARHAMQALGTEFGRDMIGRDFWANIWLRQIKSEDYDADMIIADDVRFENEVEAIKKNGGIVICVVKDIAQYAIQPEHRSEAWHHLPFTRLVENDGTPQQLGKQLAHIVRDHFYPKAHAQSA